MESNKRNARIAGIFYLMVIIFGVFAQIVRSIIIVIGDGAATVRNILDSDILFRLGFISDLFMMTWFVLLVMTLYKLLKDVNKNHAIIMVIFVVVSAPINFLNLLNHFAPLLFLNNAEYMTIFNKEQLFAQVSVYSDLYLNGYMIASIFFGLWLLPLGLLVVKSGFIPKIFGIMLVVSSICFIVDVLVHFLFPEIHGVVAIIVGIPSTIGEIGFCLWLLIKGTKSIQTQN